MIEELRFAPGERITHSEFGAGVVLDAPHDGYLRAFFSNGERRVPLASIQRQLSRTERILGLGRRRARSARGGHG